MSRPVARYCRSTRFAWLTLAAILGSLFSAWEAQSWAYSYIAAGLFALSAFALEYIACQPSVDIYDTHLAIGRRTIAWPEIRSVEHLGWLVPLVVRLRLLDGRSRLLVFAGERETAVTLLEHVRRMSREAVLDGVEYRQFWKEREPAKPSSAGTRPVKGSAADSKSAKSQEAPARYRLLRPEDEAEVEQMYQRLKSVGHMESRDSQDSEDQ